MGFSARVKRRCYSEVFGADAVPKAGECHDYIIDLVGLLCNLAFVVGSVCFASSSNFVVSVGDWCYIGACLINTYLAGRSCFKFVVELADDDPNNDPEDTEFNEETMFLLSSAVFTFGCVCFMPGLPPAAAAIFNDGLGAWLCIAGSFMLVAAAYWNALGLANHKVAQSAAAKLTYKLNKLILACTLCGAVLFTVGSFMYRPSFGGQCPRHSTNTICISISSYGTFLYLAGSVVFTVASLFSFPVTVLKYHGSNVSGESTPLRPKSIP